MPEPLQNAFVIMSFSEEDALVFKEGISKAIESLGIAAIRVDYQHFTGRITDEMAYQLRTSYFVVAEMSHERPNCYYEVGYAHALGRPVILLINDPSKIHFDIRDFPFVVYQSIQDLKDKLQERIINSVLTQLRTTEEGDTRYGMYGKVAYRNGRLLSARVTESNKLNTKLTLQVAQTSGESPLTGKVRFHLHWTYEPATYSIDVRDGAARLDIEAEGAFTVGAVADGKLTRLELNLRQVPGAHPKFYKP